MTTEQLRVRVAAFLKRNNIAPSDFGRRVMGDSAWVFRFLDGFEPKERTRAKVLDAMRTWPK